MRKILIPLALLSILSEISAAAHGGWNNSGRSPSMSRGGYHPYQQSYGQSRQQYQNAFQKTQPQQLSPQTANQMQAQYHNAQNNYRATSNQVGNQVAGNHPGYNNWFNGDFYNRHNYWPNYYDDHRDWWGAPGWNDLAGWYGWTDPYNYNDSGYYYLLSQENANSSQPVVTSQQPAYQQSTATSQQSNQGNWMPLGVFAVGKNDSVAAVSNMFVQLAVDKQGDVAGTYYNASTDETHSIDGAVNKQTQQVVWKVDDDPNAPMMVTGMYNLTQDQAPVQVQFQDGSEQNWVLVRINNK